MTRIFIVCPVRRARSDEQQRLYDYVTALEAQGHEVHYPPRDTAQRGDGWQICLDNRAAIEAADEVHVLWQPSSKGTLFDLGIAWALRKPLYLIEKVAPPGSQRAFEHVLLHWEWANRA